jgi:hypothetical protein
LGEGSPAASDRLANNFHFPARLTESGGLSNGRP